MNFKVFEFYKNYGGLYYDFHGISTKIEVHENTDFTVQTYICQQFNCEVCLTPYQSRFRIEEYNKVYHLIDYTIASELDYHDHHLIAP